MVQARFRRIGHRTAAPLSTHRCATFHQLEGSPGFNAGTMELLKEEYTGAGGDANPIDRLEEKEQTKIITNCIYTRTR